MENVFSTMITYHGNAFLGTITVKITYMKLAMKVTHSLLLHSRHFLSMKHINGAVLQDSATKGARCLLLLICKERHLRILM